ncbi:Beta-hexosaminidase 2 [Glycine soja]|uniref:Beta-hexosaminidase n=1 Tax=Glycine soja TaxID=3848 RepID=A0A445GYQ3_GLYSO|nr:Beta-hexosaminidase 2 [Glycine soja]
MPNNSEQCTLNNHNQLVAKTKKPHVGPTIPSHLIASTFTITTSAPHHNKHLSAAVARYQNLVKSEHHHPLVPSGANISTNIPPLKSLILTVLDPNAGLVHDPLRSPFLGHPHCKDHVGRHARTGDILPACIGQPYVRCSGGAVEAMSMNKLNVFHWHVTDSQSFPLVLPLEPALAEKGAYSSHMVYSPEDVKRVVEFGLDHGVRVMPEIDSPGHTGSWALAYPEIVTCANMFWWPAEGDILAAEPGAGADEIVPGCWKTDPTIQKYLSKGGTLSQVLEKFINNTLPFIVSLNRTVVYWEDVLLSETVHVPSTILPKEHVVLQTWNNGHNNTKRIVSSGYRAIVSSSDFYYLDCGHGGFVGNNSIYDQQNGGDKDNGGSWCGPFKTWQTIYNYDIAYGLSEEEEKLVLGGEVALWTEQADSTVLDGRIWPRSSALAESLWSGNRDEKGMKRYAEATDRFNEWRSRMVSRGIGAEPIQPLWCVRNPGMCNTVH